MFQRKNKFLSAKVFTIEAELDFAIPLSTTGRDLFEQIVKTLGLREIWYFGLQYVDTKGARTWVKLNRRLIDEDLPPRPEESSMVLYFSVKFFPEDASEELIQEVTKRFFFLQTKEAILNGELFCPAETCVLLASYACQAKFGDYEPEFMPLGYLGEQERLLPVRIVESHTLELSEWEKKVVEWYRELRGTFREDAMVEYLKIAQDLEMYGVTYFEITNKRGTELYLGVDAMGLNIYERSDKLTPKVGFPWSEIRHISFSDKKFIIKSTDKKAPDFTFFVSRLRTNKRILTLAMGNHELYVRRRGDESIEVSQLKSQAREERLLKVEEKEKLQREAAARGEAERRLHELQARLNEQEERAERYIDVAQGYECRIVDLEAKYQEEKRHREELEGMRGELEANNKSLANATSVHADEYGRLLAENERIRDEMSAKNVLLTETSAQLTEVQRDLDRLRLEREAAQRLHAKEADFPSDSKSFDHLFDNGFDCVKNRSEENRECVLGQDRALSEKLRMLEVDLKAQRDAQKKEVPEQVINDENKKAGRDKFKTLKQIRLGNTKKRIDEFESM